MKIAWARSWAPEARASRPASCSRSSACTRLEAFARLAAFETGYNSEPTESTVESSETKVSPVDFSMTRYEYGCIVISSRSAEDSKVSTAAQLPGLINANTITVTIGSRRNCRVLGVRNVRHRSNSGIGVPSIALPCFALQPKEWASCGNHLSKILILQPLSFRFAKLKRQRTKHGSSITRVSNLKS